MRGPSERIDPARVAFNERGVPYSEAFGDVYHSADGGRAQAAHVFIAGNALRERWRERGVFTVLETGFGLGLNFLETWHAARRDPHAPRRLHFVSVERHPFAAPDLALLHAAWPELAPLSASLVAAWPPPLAGLHRLHFDGGRVTLTLALGDARALLPEIEAQADALYLDGFVPTRNPELWSREVCAHLARLTLPGGTLATWTVAGGVRDALSAAGFELALRPGFGRKRQMLTGRKPGKAAPRAIDRRAVVIGAGLAGTSVAERLAARDWTVKVVEEREAPGRGASGNPAGVVQPVLNLADAPNARFSRTAYLYAQRHLAGLLGAIWRPTGVLRIARAAAQAERFARILATLHAPPAFARPVAQDEAAALAGHETSGPGVWFPGGGWADPASVCVANLARHDERITVRFGQPAAPRDRFEVPVVVDASGPLLPDTALRLALVRGQVTLLPPSPARRLSIAVTGEGYVAPMAQGGHCVGATFHHDDLAPQPRATDHAANLGRVDAMLPGFAAGVTVAELGGRVGFRVTTADRMPVFGEHAGRYVATGLGARGLVWAPLCAEILVCRLEGEPLPIECSLADAIAPARLSPPRR